MKETAKKKQKQFIAIQNEYHKLSLFLKNNRDALPAVKNMVRAQRAQISKFYFNK